MVRRGPPDRERSSGLFGRPPVLRNFTRPPRCRRRDLTARLPPATFPSQPAEPLGPLASPGEWPSLLFGTCWVSPCGRHAFAAPATSGTTFRRGRGRESMAHPPDQTLGRLMTHTATSSARPAQAPASRRSASARRAAQPQPGVHRARGRTARRARTSLQSRIEGLESTMIRWEK